MSFWTGSLSKSVKTYDERSTFAILITLFLNIYFHDFSVKSYLILCAKQSKSGSESSVSCLNQGSEMSNFLSYTGSGFVGLGGTPLPRLPLSAQGCALRKIEGSPVL